MESELYNFDRKCMVTLTYDDEHLPLNSDGIPTLQYSDVQSWMKNFRNVQTRQYNDFTPIRFICACEYGAKTERPHYHLILWGYKFDRKESNFRYSHDSSKGIPCYVNNDIGNTWKNGMHTIQLYDDACGMYIAQYALKDSHILKSDKAYYKYRHIDPPKLQMSRKPGIGHDFIIQHEEEIRTAVKELADITIDADAELNVPKLYLPHKTIYLTSYVFKVLQLDEYSKYKVRQMYNVLSELRLRDWLETHKDQDEDNFNA